MEPHVLIVEDEKILAEAACVYLTRHGYRTRMSHSGEDALTVLDDACPDVAILDVKLPGIDGFEVLRRLRDRSPATEVVMMTAYSSVGIRAEAARHGVFHYLSKPVDLDELRRVVGQAVASVRGSDIPPVAEKARNAGAAVGSRCARCPCTQRRASCSSPAKLAC
jgi:DNA-binding NtrC family response regulator